MARPDERIEMLDCATCGKPEADHDYENADACDYTAPDEAYTLRDYTRSGGGQWIAADCSPWQIKVCYTPDGYRLDLILGDMNYHDIDLTLLRIQGAKNTAAIYDETDGKADIEQILLAALRLLEA
jgi:hypothetical protein